MIKAFTPDLAVVAHMDIKCWYEPFNQMANGNKLHEFRRNDRDYREGQLILVREWLQEELTYTGRCLLFRIGAISYGPSWGIPEGYCVFTVHRMSNVVTVYEVHR